MKIDLKPAIEYDRSFFRHAHHQAYRSVIESMFDWNEEEQDRFADRDFDTRNPHIILYNNQACGVVGWQNKSDHIWFGPIFILPECQNKGIGQVVVNTFIDRANETKLALRLQTLRQNEGAKFFYEKLGFYVSSFSEKYWQMEYLEK